MVCGSTILNLDCGLSSPACYYYLYIGEWGSQAVSKWVSLCRTLFFRWTRKVLRSCRCSETSVQSQWSAVYSTCVHTAAPEEAPQPVSPFKKCFWLMRLQTSLQTSLTNVLYVFRISGGLTEPIHLNYLTRWLRLKCSQLLPSSVQVKFKFSPIENWD